MLAATSAVPEQAGQDMCCPVVGEKVGSGLAEDVVGKRGTEVLSDCGGQVGNPAPLSAAECQANVPCVVID